MRYLYIPTNLNLKLKKKEEKHRDKYNYFISQLTEQYVYDKSLKHKDCWVSLNTNTLGSILNTRILPRIKDKLFENCIVECDGIARKNEKNYYYRFTPRFRSQKVIAHMILDSVFEEKLEKFRQHRISRLDNTTQFLYDNLTRLSISEQALKFLDTNFTGPDYNYAFSTYHKICTGDYFFTRDTTGNRVHNNFSNEHKELLQFNYLKDLPEAKLVNLDIRNSQPLLFSILLRREYGINKHRDVEKYIELCESGNLYNHLMEIFEVDKNISRKNFKQMVFAKLFYCKNQCG